MKIIIKIIGLIPFRKLVKYLPEIIAFIITKVWRKLSVTQPEKLKNVVEFLDKITRVARKSLDAGKDGIYDTKEIIDIANEWRK